MDGEILGDSYIILPWFLNLQVPNPTRPRPPGSQILAMTRCRETCQLSRKCLNSVDGVCYVAWGVMKLPAHVRDMRNELELLPLGGQLRTCTSRLVRFTPVFLAVWGSPMLGVGRKLHFWHHFGGGVWWGRKWPPCFFRLKAPPLWAKSAAWKAYNITTSLPFWLGRTIPKCQIHFFQGVFWGGALKV